MQNTGHVTREVPGIRTEGFKTDKSAWERFEEKIHNVGTHALNGVEVFFVKVAQIRMDPNALGRVFKIGVHVFTVIEIAMGKPGNFAAISSRIDITKNVADATQIFDSFFCFASESKPSDKKKKGTVESEGEAGSREEIEKKGKRDLRVNKSISKTFGCISMAIASIGTVFQILDQCKIIDLARIGLSLGPVPVLGTVLRSGLTFGQVIVGFSTAGYTWFGVDAVSRLVDATKNKNDKEQIQASIEIAWTVAEVASGVFSIVAGIFLAGPFFVGGTIFLGTVSASLGIASYLHQKTMEEQQESKAKAAASA